MKPSQEELDAAPMLDAYIWAGWVAIGTVTGHPTIDDWTRVVTSPVVDVDRENDRFPEWMRTCNTLYRLGIPVEGVGGTRDA